MQRQTNMLNLFAEFRFQLFNIKAPYYFKLRISARIIERILKQQLLFIQNIFPFLIG